jgi:hypothetical protein
MKKITILILYLIFTSQIAFADTITLTDFYDYAIFQRNLPVDHYGSLTIAGTYSGTPTTIEAQVINASTSAVVKDWTTIDASPSGDAFSGSLTDIQEGCWYYVNVRYSNDHDVVDNGTNHVGIGILLGVLGQSNGYHMTITPGVITPNSNIKEWYYRDTDRDIGWNVPVGAGIITLGNLLFNTYNIPIGFVDYCYNGSSITEWTYESEHYIRFRDYGIAYTGGKLEYVIWWQGEADLTTGMSTSDYQEKEATLISLIRTDTGQDTLPFFVPLVTKNNCGKNPSLVDTAKKNNSIALSYYSALTTEELVPLWRSDCSHFNYSSYEFMAIKIYDLITGNYALISGGSGAGITTGSGYSISVR